MNKQITSFVFAIILLTSMASAFCFWWWCPTPEIPVVEPSNENVGLYPLHFWQKQYHSINSSFPNQTTNSIVIQYNKYDLDYVSGSNPLEFFIYYGVMIKTWNTNNPDYNVQWCNLTAKVWHSGDDNPYYIVSKKWENQDYINAKEFFSLYDGDDAFIDITCKFNGTKIPSAYESPVSMQMTTPTWKCKACQRYEWAVVEQSTIKSEDLSSKITQITNYIKQVIFLNFEMWVILFWILTILLLLVAISLIFIGMYWVFNLIKRQVK